MNKLQEYLRKKKLSEQGLPTLWVVKSNCEGVQLPVAIEVIEVVENCGVLTTINPLGEYERTSLRKYVFENNDSIDFPENSDFVEEQGHGTGIGDLWCWTNFYTISKDRANEFYVSESIRIADQYNT